MALSQYFTIQICGNDLDLVADIAARVLAPMTSTTQLTPLRYDSPTVTLEVMAREAAVSQWSDKPVVQILRYQLQVRDLSEAAEVVEIRGDRASFLPLMMSVQHYVQAQLTGEVAADAPAANAPYLTPDSLTQHTWHLGHAQTSAGATDVRLSTGQLADLEAVLDQLNDAVRPLPVPLVPAQQRRPWRQWGTAAAGLVAAVGITTALWPNYQSPSRLETAQEVPSADAELSPPPEPQSLPPRAASSAAPDGADSTAAREPGPTGETLPEAPSSLERSRPPADPGVKNDAVAIAPSTASPSAGTAPKPDDAVPDPFSDRGTGDAAPPSIAESAPLVPAPSSRPTPGTVTAPPSPPREPAAPPPSRANPSVSPEAETEVLAEDIPEMLAAEETQRALPLAEPDFWADWLQPVRDRWSPPTDLEQTLTYTLVVAADGTLIEVIPADAVAAEYRDRTGIPAVGTVGLPAGDLQRILLLFKPNGDVELRDAGAD